MSSNKLYVNNLSKRKENMQVDLFNNNIDINSEDHIFTFICSEKNNQNTNNIIYSIYQLEDKVSNILKNKHIENISTKYSNYNIDLEWIDKEYRNLVIRQVSKDLITRNILSFFKK